jgi:ribose transport system permease protein
VSPRAIATRILSSNRGTVLLVVLVLVFWSTTPHFLGENNIDNVLIQSALTGTIAIAMAVAFIGGQFDLSVGSVLALGGFVSVHAAGAGTGVAFAAAIATGAACGLVNGIVVAVLRVNAFIATLGTMSVIGGVTLVASNQQSASTDAAGFLNIATAQVGPIPTFAVVFFVLAIVGTLVMRCTPVGVTIRALGANAEFCRLNGVHMVSHRIAIFLCTGMAAGLSGAMTAAWVGGADPNAGSTVPLLVISACILGGVSLYGGVGTIGQAVGGTMALTVLVDGMTLLNISPYYQTVLEGAVLVTVVTVAALVHMNVMTRVWLASVVARVRAAWAYSTPTDPRSQMTGGENPEVVSPALRTSRDG